MASVRESRGRQFLDCRVDGKREGHCVKRPDTPADRQALKSVAAKVDATLKPLKPTVAAAVLKGQDRLFEPDGAIRDPATRGLLSCHAPVGPASQRCIHLRAPHMPAQFGPRHLRARPTRCPSSSFTNS